MRCGLVRLVTRRCPYDVKIRRKGWNTVQKGGDASALKDVAESRVIGRYCAHKMCRLVEKSSKLVSRVSSGNNLTSRKISSTKSPFFDQASDCDYNNLFLKNSEVFDRNNLKFRLSGTVHSQTSKFVLKLQNYSTKESNQNGNITKSIRPIRIHSKPKVYNYKRYSSQKLSSKRNITTSKTHKRWKNKNASSRKLYVVRSPFITYHKDSKDNKYLSKLKQNPNCPYDNLDKSDFGQGFLDHNVLNHLNETSYLSLCGCEICEKKLKKYEKKNNKINKLLQNKVSKILNYCKKKNPFYKIYSQNKSKNDIDMKEFGMYGINGWLNYLDACECTDWTQYKLGSNKSTQNTKNKCVSTNNDQVCDIDNNTSNLNEDNCATEKKVTKLNEAVNSKEEWNLKDKKLPGPSCASDKAQDEGKKDNCTTQTHDLSEPQVTNYYYITNNTLNTNCCCKDEFPNPVNMNEYCNKFQTEKSNTSKVNDFHMEKQNSNKQELKDSCRGGALNNFCKTMNKVYDVMMKPVSKYEKDKLGYGLCDENCQDNLTEDIKACNANNFEYYDSESHRPCNMNLIRDGCSKSSKDKVLNFDEFMDMKYRQLKEYSIGENRFLRYDDMEFKDLTKKATVKVKGDEYGPEHCIAHSKYEPYNPESYKPVNNRIEKKWQTLDTEYNPLSTYGIQAKNGSGEENTVSNHELGPLDHINKFESTNIERYEEKEELISKGPNFSNFPDSHWRSSLFRTDNKLSRTFDVSHPSLCEVPIKITTSNARDLAKYSEINMAIDKVRKKINDIINESDENVCLNREQLGRGNNFNSNIKHSSPQLLKNSEKSEGIHLNSLNNDEHIFKSDKDNIKDWRKDSDFKEQKVINNSSNKGNKRCDVASDQTNHHPSSVHLNEIIEAIKEHKCCENSKTNRSRLDCKRNMGYNFNGPLPQRTSRKIPLKNNVFIFNPNPDPQLGSLGTENLVNRGEVARYMSTSSKYKPFIGNEPNRIHKKPHKSNFMDGTIFSTDNFLSEGWENEKTIKLKKKKSYLKYMENRMKQKETGYIGDRVFEHNMLEIPSSKINRQYKSIERISDDQRDCQQELFNKSIDIFSKNNDMENVKKTEYSTIPTIRGVANRYNVKVSSSNERFNGYDGNIGKTAEEKRWKIWDPKDWQNQGDNRHAKMISKGFCNDGETEDANCENPEGGDIIFNERRERAKQVVRGLDDNCAGDKAVMNNDAGKQLDRFNCRPNNQSGVDNSYCINVGDLGLNFTSFSIEKPVERGNKRGKTSVETGRLEVGKSVHGSESRINKLGIANTSMSRQADLHLRQIRTVGLRPCNKNDVPHNSFRIRNSIFMNGKNTLRPVSPNDTLNRRQVSTNDTGFKSTMSDKLKNIERIDQVEYLKEEKYLSEKEAVRSIKTKESYISPSNKIENSFDLQGQSEVKNYRGLGICTKEVEKRMKNRAIGDTNVTKQITEEMNVSGIFPEGKKTVHGKIVSVLAKPKNLFTTSLKNRNKGSEAIKSSDYKDPITIQVLYETMTDHSVGEHIDKAKRKIYVGDVKRKKPIIKPVYVTDSKYDYETDEKQPNLLNEETELTTAKKDSSEQEVNENKTKWKKYDPNNSEFDSKKYYAELKKIIKKQKMKSRDTRSDKNNYLEDATLSWQAPKNIVFEKIIGREDDINEWMQKRDNYKYQTKEHITKPDSNIESTEDFKNDFEGTSTQNNETKLKLQSTTTTQRQASSEKRLDERKESDTVPNIPKSIIDVNMDRNIEVTNESEGFLKGEDAKSIEERTDNPTTGEAKYEIDSDNFDNTESSSENEKLVVTHFKQFRRPDVTKDSLENMDQQNFILEASMLKVTLVQEGKMENVKSVLEIQSIESLSNDVERELNDIVSPHIKDMILNEAKTARNHKIAFKPNNYFLDMLNPNYRGATTLENKPTLLEEKKDTNTDDVTSDNKNNVEQRTDLANILRTSIEQMYTKKISAMPHHQSNDNVDKIKLDESLQNDEEKELTPSEVKESYGQYEPAKDNDTSSKEIVDMTTKERDEVFSRISSDSLSEIPEIRSSNINDVIKSENIQGKRKTKAKPSSTRYETVVKEIKQMLVKDEKRAPPQTTNNQVFKDEQKIMPKTQDMVPSNEVKGKDAQNLKVESHDQVKEAQANTDDLLPNRITHQNYGQIKLDKELIHENKEREEARASDNEDSNNQYTIGKTDQKDKAASKESDTISSEERTEISQHINTDSLSEIPEVRSDNFNEVLRNENASRKIKPQRSSTRYDTIVKELKQMFVKDENNIAPQNMKYEASKKEKVSTTQENLPTNEIKEKEVQKVESRDQENINRAESDDGLTSPHEHEFNEQEELIEQKVRVANSNRIEMDQSRSEPVIESNAKSRSRGTIKETNKMDSRSKIKSVYKSYESAIKPKFFDVRSKRRSQEKLMKASKTVLKKDSPDKEDEVVTKSKIPVLKPEEKKQNFFYSYDSSVKPTANVVNVEKDIVHKEEKKIDEEKKTENDYLSSLDHLTENKMEDVTLKDHDFSVESSVEESKSNIMKSPPLYSHDSSINLNEQKKDQLETVLSKETLKKSDEEITKIDKNEAKVDKMKSESPEKYTIRKEIESPDKDKIKSEKDDNHLASSIKMSSSDQDTNIKSKYPVDNLKFTKQDRSLELTQPETKPKEIEKTFKEPKELKSAKLAVERLKSVAKRAQESKKALEATIKELSRKEFLKGEAKFQKSSKPEEMPGEKAVEGSSTSVKKDAPETWTSKVSTKFIDSARESKLFKDKRKLEAESDKILKSKVDTDDHISKIVESKVKPSSGDKVETQKPDHKSEKEIKEPTVKQMDAPLHEKAVEGSSTLGKKDAVETWAAKASVKLADKARESKLFKGKKKRDAESEKIIKPLYDIGDVNKNEKNPDSAVVKSKVETTEPISKISDSKVEPLTEEIPEKEMKELTVEEIQFKDDKKQQALKKSFSRDIIVEDAVEPTEKTDRKEKKPQMISKAHVDIDSDKKVDQPEEEFEIAASSFTQYDERDDEAVVDKTLELDTEQQDKSTEEAPEEKKVKKDKPKRKLILPPPDPKRFVPYEKVKTEQDIELEAWEKQPTYLKNLRPAFYKIKRLDIRHKNIEDNEKKFKDLKLLNKITNVTKVSDCSCKKSEKWVADMCCSLEDEKEKHKQASGATPKEPLEAEESTKNRPTSKGGVVRSGRGYRSTEWPENLSRKKDAVIKQPSTPRPPWRN